MKKGIIKKALATFALCAFITCTPVLFLLLNELGAMPKGVSTILEFIAMVSFIPYYGTNHILCALVFRRALAYTKKDFKTMWLLPVIPLIFAVSACVFISVAMLQKPLTSVFYCLMTSLIYLIAALAELFAKKFCISKALDKSIFAFSSFAYFFQGSLFIMSVEGSSGDKFGFRFIYSLFICVPIFFVLTGIFVGLQREKISFLPLACTAFFLLYVLLAAGEINCEFLLFAIVYTVLGYIAFAITKLVNFKNKNS